jgi:hypothetical protein
MMLYELRFAFPNYSYARGFLLTVGMDTFQGEAMKHETMEPTMRKYVIGRIKIEIGGQNATPVIEAAPFRVGATD